MVKSKDATNTTDRIVSFSTTSSTTATPTKHTAPAPAVPLQIPTRSKRDPAHFTRNHHGRHPRTQRPRDVYAPDAVPSAIHALLAVTNIPRPKNGRGSLRKKPERDEVLVLEAVVESQQLPEEELSISLGSSSRSPLDLLLSAPEDLEDDDDDSTSFSDSAMGSVLSSRTESLESTESVPSLGPSMSSPFSPLDSSPVTPPLRRRRTSSQLTRRSLEPLSFSPHGEAEPHPLSAEVTIEELDFRVFESPAEEAKSAGAFSRLPLRSAFKSNLTASLRAIRSAAKSFSSLSLASIPPDDFLTRSILTIDPRVPYTDERRPPVLEEEPSAALRRYLNPTTGSRVESGPVSTPRSSTRAFTASIQMQTYKIQRSNRPSPSRLPLPIGSRFSETTSKDEEQRRHQQQQQQAAEASHNASPSLPARQREMRENSDFIRIAVLEMAMRKRGKLDDQRPGRARWALPPRKPATAPYEVRADGVPVRWIPIAC